MAKSNPAEGQSPLRESSTSAFPFLQEPMFWLKALAIVVAGICVLFPTLSGTWYGDDDMYLTKNPLLNDPNRIWKAWFEPGSFIEYYPIEQTVQWCQWKLWGLDSTFNYLVCNLVLHLTSALLLWHLFSKLGLKLAWLGGLIFAIHPLMVDTVGVSCELKSTLSLPPFLLALGFYLDFERSHQARFYVLALLLFLVAMLCKITMIFFPFVILLYAWWKRGGIVWDDCRQAIPFFVISFVLGLCSLHAGIVYAVVTHYHSPAPIHLGGISERLALAGLSLAFYFGHCIFPLPQMPFYPLWKLSPPSPQLYAPWLGLALVLGFCWTKRQSWGRPVLFALGFFALGVAPFLGLKEISYMCLTWVSDHFVYMPIIALIGLAVAGIERVGPQLPGQYRPYGIAVVALAVTLLGFQTYSYAKLFANREQLWTHNLEYNPDMWLARYNLASELADRGAMDEAIGQFKQVIHTNPDFLTAYLALAGCLFKTGNFSEAIDSFQDAIRVNPDFTLGHLYLASAFMQAGRTPEAIAQFELFLKIQPNSVNAHFGLAGALATEKRFPEAITQLEIAHQLAPNEDTITKQLDALKALAQQPVGKK